MKLYFGHPVNSYGTVLEKEMLEAISNEFPDWEIENPNQPKHQEGYRKRRRETGNGMSYFFEEVLTKMQGGVFAPFQDGMFGAGVFNEANFLKEEDKRIWRINYRRSLEGTGHSFDFEEIFELDPRLGLSVDETRRIVYQEQMKRPLQSLLIAPGNEREKILSGEKKVTIRNGLRDYHPGFSLLACHIEPWCVGIDITNVRHCILGQISEREMQGDGYKTREEMLEDLRNYYPEINLDSKVTVIEWENPQGKLVGEYESQKKI